MGDYAIDSIERDLDTCLDGDEDEIIIVKKRKPKANQFEFKFIEKETDKARLFVMSGGNRIWLSKKVCEITDNLVNIPKWLQKSIMESAYKKSQRELKQLKLNFV